MDDKQIVRIKANTAILSVLCNLILIAAKVVVGIMAGSVSVISEAIHSGIDLLAALIAYFSVRAAGRPPDKEHQFGHGKIENLSGYLQAALILFAAALIIHEAYDKILKGSGVEFIGMGIGVMALSVILNWLIGLRLLFIARKYYSAALEADALHHLTDVYTSVGVLGGLVLVKLTGWNIIDPIAAIMVAALIMIAAYRLSRKSVQDLVDVKLTDEEETHIRKILEAHTREFVGFHGMRTRRAGNNRFIDLHLVVHDKTSVDKAHSLAEHLEEELVKAFPGSQVLIHIEPCENTCGKCNSRCSLAASNDLGT